MSTRHNSLAGLKTSQSRDGLAIAVRERAVELDRLIEGLSTEQHKALSRPRLHLNVLTVHGERWYTLDLQTDNGEVLCLSRKTRTFELAAYAGNPASEYLVRFPLDVGFLPGDSFMQDDANARAFVHAAKVLDEAKDALVHNRPMDGNLTGPQSLVKALMLANGVGDGALWRQWVEVWGTNEMAQGMQAASALVEPNDDFATWKQLVLSSWTISTAHMQLTIPMDAFDGTMAP